MGVPRLRRGFFRSRVSGGAPWTSPAACPIIQWNGWRRLAGTFQPWHAIPVG